jgi:hypothetical protein
MQMVLARQKAATQPATQGVPAGPQPAPAPAPGEQKPAP